MDPDSDSDSDDEGNSGIEVPPACVLLKRILFQYKDVQIIKELVQNAEDAGATEIKILFDGTTRNGPEETEYNKYFKGPALCVYNNAIFKKADWRDIRRIYASAKEKKPLTIGRFGLGFKSVFHITDFPCIISKKRILLINPFEKRHFFPKRLNDKRLKDPIIISALSGKFGMSEDNFSSGTFDGTLFWFPLRQSPTDLLCETVYDVKMIVDLLQSARSEATDYLLFLKNLSKLELNFQGCELQGKDEVLDSFVLELDDGVTGWKEERMSFQTKAENMNGEIPDDDITSVTKLCFKTTHKQSTSTSEERCNWLVADVYKGGERMRELRTELAINFLPRAGVAAPLQQSQESFKGNLFCFLPLPEDANELHLPVHINGSFALSQDRGHVEWAKPGSIKDKPMEWNDHVLVDIAPVAYALLVDEMIKESQKIGNTEASVQQVYNCIPDLSAVNKMIKPLATTLCRLLVTKPMVCTNASKWIRPEDALYVTFDNKDLSTDVIRTVEKVVTLRRSNIIKHLPEHISQLIRESSGVEIVSPENVAGLLRSEGHGQTSFHLNITAEERLWILEYILLKEDHSLIEELHLLCLEDSSFVPFSKDDSTCPIYIGSNAETELFPGLGRMFVSTKISDKQHRLVQAIGDKGIYQVQPFNTAHTGALLKLTMQKNFGSLVEPIVLQSVTSSNITWDQASWLKNVWTYLMENLDELTDIEDLPLLPLIPDCTEYSWDNSIREGREVHLYSMKHVFVVKSTGTSEKPALLKEICEGLALMSVKVIPCLPSWIDPKRIPCVYLPRRSHILRMFETLELGKNDVVQNFNLQSNRRTKDSLAEYFYCIKGEKLTSNQKMFLRKLELFKKVSCSEQKGFVSLDQNNKFLLDDGHFPLQFPESLVIVHSDEEKKFALALGAEEINYQQLAFSLLRDDHINKLSDEDRQAFMTWFLLIINLKDVPEDVLERTVSIRFVPQQQGFQKPSETFDPSNKLLKRLFNAEDKFPMNDFASGDLLKQLQHLGLKTVENVTSAELLHTAELLDQWCNAGNANPALFDKAAALFEIISHYQLVEVEDDFWDGIKNLQCILHQRKKPDGYPDEIPWEGEKRILSRPSELKGTAFSNKVGSVLPLVECTSSCVIGSKFGWEEIPCISDLTKQLKNVLLKYNESKKQENFLPMLGAIYEDLQKHGDRVHQDADFKVLLEDGCIWWGDGFCKPKEFVLTGSQGDVDLQPYVYHLPPQMQRFATFFRCIGCYEKQDAEVLLTVQQRINSRYDGDTSVHSSVEVQKDLNILLRILARFAKDKSILLDEEVRHTILLPVVTSTQSRLVLKHREECLFTEAFEDGEQTYGNKGRNSDEEENGSLTLLHSSVTEEIAEGLGVKSLRQYKKDRHQHKYSEGLPFEQTENLVTRLNGLLRSYQLDTAIIKELLQNADDAGATEVHFVKDFSTHESNSVFNKEYAAHQGPALLIYNNSAFNKNDLKGIQNLGIGSKRENPEKTGKFGVGFNVVYNLTDVPSFLSKGGDIEEGETLCIFDPMHTFLKEVKGRRYMASEIRNGYPDVFTPFHEDVLLKDPVGTVFRLPLRTKESAISRHVATPGCIEELFSGFKSEMFEMLLFLQSVKKVKVSEITSGELQVEYTVQLSITEETVSNSRIFFEEKRSMAMQFLSNPCIVFNAKPEEVQYRVSIEDDHSKLEDWFVVQRLGFEDDRGIQDINITAFNRENIQCLPVGGVAMRIPKEGKSTSGGSHDVYCGLPLSCKTGLPCHVSGDFAVDASRSTLVQERTGLKSAWNNLVIQKVVLRAYLTALKFMQKFIFTGRCDGSDRLKKKIKLFDSYMPVFKEANEDCWKAFVTQVYKIIIKEQINIFPVVSKSGKVSWTSYQPSGFAFPIYTSNESSFHGRTESTRENFKYLLTELGMRIIETSADVIQSMEDAGLRVKAVCTDEVIDFLKSHTSTFVDKVKIGRLPCSIGTSGLKTIENVLNMLKYCKRSEQFQTESRNLPLMVTSDDKVRTIGHGLIWTKYSDLFPAHSEKFVHRRIFNEFETDEEMKRLLEKFSMDEIASLLPSVLLDHVLTSSSEMSFGISEKPAQTYDWLKRFWSCIYENVKFAGDRKQKFKNHLFVISNWCLIPAKQERRMCLVQVEQIKHIVDLDSFQNGTGVKMALKKMDFPVLDIASYDAGLKELFSQLITSANTPCLLLDKIFESRERFHTSNLTEEDRKGILVFFSQVLQQMRREENDVWIKTRIKALPVFSSIEGASISLEVAPNTTCIAVPKDLQVPSSGISEWASMANTIVLQVEKDFKSIYDYLEIDIPEPEDIYRKYIFKQWDCVSDDSAMQHVRFIKDELLLKPAGKGYTERQNQLAESMQDVPFILVAGTRKKPVDCFSHKQKIFKLLCSENDLLPAQFRGKKSHGDEWEEFMIKVGVITEPTATLFIRLAKQVANRGMEGRITEQIRQQSKELVKYLLLKSEPFDDNALSAIADIKFIVPFKVCQKYSGLCPQFHGECPTLTSFSQSCPCTFKKLVWTCMPLLPKWACPATYKTDTEGEPPHDLYVEKLHILKKPPITSFLAHCKTIFPALAKQSEDLMEMQMNLGWLPDLMNNLYNHLSEEISEHGHTIKRQLRGIPSIHLPDKHVLVDAENVVLRITEEESVYPYLNKAPQLYMKYYYLFQVLGAVRQISGSHYLKVTEELKAKANGKRLSISDINVMKAVLKNYLKYQNNESTKMHVGLSQLYLPDRNYILYPAYQLVFSDNPYFEGRLGCHSSVKFFIGFDKLDIAVKDEKRAIQSLPKAMQPQLLTCLVEEIVESSQIKIEESTFAPVLEAFLKSEKFVHGLLRLVNHDKVFQGSCLETEDEEKIAYQISNVQVQAVTGLKTFLYIKNTKIEESGRTKDCFFFKKLNNDGNEDFWVIYLQKADEENHWLQAIGGLIDFVDKVTFGCMMKEAFKYIPALLSHAYLPQEDIPTMLDKLKVDSYKPSVCLPFNVHVPRPDEEEAARWMEQAKYDLQAAKTCLNGKDGVTSFTNDTDTERGTGCVDSGHAFNWICYKCHQAAEKSLKAAWFSKDATEGWEHSINSMADGLGNHVLTELVASLSGLVGSHTKMRYPDQFPKPNIPATFYTRAMAVRACELTSDILRTIEKNML